MEYDIMMTVYSDDKGVVHGRIVDFGDNHIEILMPENKSDVGLSIYIVKDGEDVLLITGSGERKGDKLTMELDLTVQDKYFGTVTLDGFDDRQFKAGNLVGGIGFKPSRELFDFDDEDMPEVIKSLLEDVELIFDLNVVKTKTDIKLTVLTDGKTILTGKLTANTGGAKSVGTASGISPDEWKDEVTLDSLEKLVAKLEKAGVPTEYTDRIDEALEDSF
jgi:hypothetical protein